MIFCLGYELLFTLSSWRVELGIGSVFFFSSPVKMSSKRYLEKAFGGTLISLSGMFPSIMLLPIMFVQKLHKQDSGKASLEQESA